MQITEKWLRKHKACPEAVVWYFTRKNKDAESLLNAIIKENEPLDWCNWYLSRKLPRVKKVSYAVFAAKQVLSVFENEYLNDKRPKEAIKAAEKYIKNPTKKNKENAANAAYDAASAANAAACDAANCAANTAASAAYAAACDAANCAANCAANTAASAAYAAAKVSAAYAANAAAHAAGYAAAAVAATAHTAKRKMMIKILKYGLGLLNKT